MRQVEVKISSTDKDDTRSVAVVTESKMAGGAPRRDDSRSVQVNGSKVETFNLRPGQRLIIEAALQDDDLVYDRDQGASVRRSAQRNEDGKADDPRNAPAEAGERQRLEQAEQRRAAEAKASGMTEAQKDGQFRTPETSNEAAQPKAGPQQSSSGPTVGQATKAANEKK